MLDDVAAYLLLSPIAVVILAGAGILAWRRTAPRAPRGLAGLPAQRPRISINR